MKKNFIEIIAQHANQRPNNIAYIFMDKETSYQTLYNEINQIAHSLLKLGLKRGDKIATLLPQSPAFVTTFMAAAAIGLVVVPLDARDAVVEMLEICQRTEPKLLVTLASPESIKEKAENLIHEYHFNNVYSYLGTLDNPQNLPYEKLLEASTTAIAPELMAQAEDPLVIIFTSGTTGKPKGVPITHRMSYAMTDAAKKVWGLDHNERMLVNLPTSHVSGTHDCIAMMLNAGGTMVLCPRFDADEAMEFIEKYKITFFGGVPTIYRLIFKTCDTSKYDLSSVRYSFTGGEPASAELIHNMKNLFPKSQVIKSWGMSETSGFLTFTHPNSSIDFLTQSEGPPGEGMAIKIVRPDGSEADIGEAGEMLIKGDNVISTYMDKKDNASAFDGGWLKTGDVGCLDEDNNLYFRGRIKQMYISGGYNVSPLEVEATLNAFAGVNTSAVIAQDDDVWGETGIAFIVPADDIALDVEKLKEYCKENLSAYKRPTKIVVAKDLPLTGIGKIAKNELEKNISKYL